MDPVFSPDHEQVVLCTDRETGLRAVIALSTTALGPGLGGTRFRPYASEADAVADVLRLSTAMAAKNAVAGLAAGGGKAVVIGDPARDRSDALLRAYGRAVASLGGRYVTACDVGTTPADMDVIGTVNPWTTGGSRERGGAGDSGELTALGVAQGLRAAAAHVWGGGDGALEGRVVAVLGLGKVGRRLVGHVLADGGRVLCADVDDAAVRRTLAEHPAAQALPVADLLEAACDGRADVLSPNALGGLLDEGYAGRLRAAVVCGGANNQLAHPGVADLLAARDVLYCPDFVVNAGGVIAVGDEGLTPPYDHERATARVLGIRDTTAGLLERAAREGVTPAAAADALAAERIAAGSNTGWGGAAP